MPPRIGEVLVSRPRVIRSTRSLIFLTTEVSCRRALRRDGQRGVQGHEGRARARYAGSVVVIARSSCDEAIQLSFVMAGLDPAIHPLRKDFCEDAWIRGSSLRMTHFLWIASSQEFLAMTIKCEE